MISTQPKEYLQTKCVFPFVFVWVQEIFLKSSKRDNIWENGTSEFIYRTLK